MINDILTKIRDFVGSSPVNSGGTPTIDDNHAGDVKIVTIELISQDMQRSFDLMSHCKTIDIFESIMSPYIIAELGIADSIGLLQDFPILGEEYVNIAFRSPGATEDTSYLLQVNRIKNKEIVRNNKMIVYVLECVSPEIITNANAKVTKKYSDTVTNNIQSILEEYIGSDKSLNLETSDGLYETNISTMAPFKAVDLMRGMAVSKKNSSSSFAFFENKKGYHFVTVEKLLDDGSKEENKEFFFDETSNNFDLKNVTARNIIAYDQPNFTDIVSKIGRGGVSNIVRRFDLITGDVIDTEYSAEEAEDFKTVDKNSISQNSSNFNRVNRNSKSNRKLIAFSTDRGDMDIIEKKSKSQAFAQKISQNITQIHIYGDSDLTVGNVITCNFPSGVGATSSGSDKIAKLDNGNYLISKLRHMIINSDRPQYTISCELIKGSLVE